MDSESGLRRAAAFPPYGELRDRTRWLLQGADLTDAKVRLRPLVRTLRDAGHRVRVDVDPIDL